MFTYIRTNLKNLLWFRKYRNVPITKKFIGQIRRASPTELQLLITNTMLAGVGLKVVEEDKDTIPPSVSLSAAQKDAIEQVSMYNYKVGLLDARRTLDDSR